MGEVERTEQNRTEQGCGLVVYLCSEDSGGNTDSFTLPEVSMQPA